MMTIQLDLENIEDAENLIYALREAADEREIGTHDLPGAHMLRRHADAIEKQVTERRETWLNAIVRGSKER